MDPDTGSNTLSTRAMRQLISSDDTWIIDVRPIDAYNGWQLEDEFRGGHISGAKSLPAKWTTYLDWIEIVRSKGIETGDPIVLYGYDIEEILRVRESFEKAGYSDIQIYSDFTDEWAADPELPMERLEKYQQLVPAPWIKSLLDGGTPQHHAKENFVVCHAHYRNPEDYEKGHIPGAIPLNTLTLESPETWNRRSPAELRDTLESLGITHDTTVVLYGRFSYPKNDDAFPGSSAGHLGAIRCAFIMMYAGVEDVRVLNGGIQAWEDAGYTLTIEETVPQPIDDFGPEIPAHPGIATDLPGAKALLSAEDGALVSVRSWKEFIGEVSGYNYIEKTGRIPGAVFADCGTDAYHMENYRNPDHTTREYHEIEALWQEAGITPDKRLAFYCGTGWRGSEAFFNAWLMGWPHISVYDGGWFEWSGNPENPIATGQPE
ncbi:MAG: thiosulfate sulfurtransferase [Candidatus Marinimicrobia bacterium]|nr:thiosulfate sulfurtransferase [Candidatus Neomarinimicrobiota bacterium]MCF7828126.1 thiosulfate sulfurtransferase [Candidatus Neomarinimicrobiota bacterium]MCF7879699.1 thiosulfate sulfurtransferase [Candidatus Neomarinimicrobiota bacterium]